MNTLLPIVRHFVAITVAWVASVLTLTDAQVTDLEGSLTTGALVVCLGIYASLEKLLKLPFRSILGEQQPGDTDPAVDP